MVNSKNISEQLSDEMIEKTSKFAEEVNTKKENILSALSWVVENKEAEQIWHDSKVKSARIFRDENDSDIAKYKDRDAIAEREKLAERLWWLFNLEDENFKADTKWEEIWFGMMKYKELAEKIGFSRTDNLAYYWVEVNPEMDIFRNIKTWEQYFMTYDAFVREIAKVKWCTKQEAEDKYIPSGDQFRDLEKIDKTEDYSKFHKLYVYPNRAAPFHDMKANGRFDIWIKDCRIQTIEGEGWYHGIDPGSKSVSEISEWYIGRILKD